MFGLGMTELIVILLIIVILFGVGKLPEIGSGLGKAIRGFRKGMSEESDQPQSRSDDPSSRKSPPV
jgi:sec-independent protein translocase protein TatA